MKLTKAQIYYRYKRPFHKTHFFDKEAKLWRLKALHKYNRSTRRWE